MIRKRFILPFFFLSLAGLHAEFEDTYSDLISMAGLDPNSGQNSFLTLLIPSGGKYQAMGTAYTAVVRDTGYLDANPATSAHLENTELTFFHNDWIDDSNLESVAYTQRMGDLGWGVAAKFLWLPFDATNTWGETTASGAYTESIITLNGSLNMLNDYYYSGFSIGFNLKTAYRGISEELAADQSAVALMGDFGVLTRFNLLKNFASRTKTSPLVYRSKIWE
jgi:hypothetical protein